MNPSYKFSFPSHLPISPDVSNLGRFWGPLVSHGFNGSCQELLSHSVTQCIHSLCRLLQPGTAIYHTIRYFSREQCLFVWQRATQVLAKTPRKGKILIFPPPISSRWMTPLLSCSAASWQFALSKIHLFLWCWKVMTSPSSKDSQKKEKPSWFLLPRAHCLYSPFSVLRQSTHFCPCLIRWCRGCRQMVHCQAPDFFNLSFLLRTIANMRAKNTTKALLTDIFLPNDCWYRSSYICTDYFQWNIWISWLYPSKVLGALKLK